MKNDRNKKEKIRLEKNKLNKFEKNYLNWIKIK